MIVGITSWRRPDKPAFVLIGLAVSLSIISLLTHASARPVILQYSLRYAVFLAVSLAAFVTVAAISVFRAELVARLVRRSISVLPVCIWDVTLVLTAAVLTWLFSIGSGLNSIVAQPFFQAGALIGYLGLVMLVYGDTDWSRMFSRPAPAVKLFASARRSEWIPQARATAMLVAIVSVIFFVYSPMLRHALLGADELQWVSYVSAHSAMAGFFEPSWFPAYYRPFQGLQAWFLFHAFGLGYFGYQSVQILTFLAAAVFVFYMLTRVGGNPWLALILTLLFATHPFVADFLIFTTDAAWITIIATCLVAAGLTHLGQDSKWWALLLFFFLAAALARENGLALIGAVSLVAIYGLGRLGWAHVRTFSILSTCAIAVALYAPFRWHAIGLFPRSSEFANDGFLFRTYYTSSQVSGFDPLQRMAFQAYAVAANLISSSFPVFANLGLPDLKIVGSLALLTAVVFSCLILYWSRGYLAQQWQSWQRSPRLLAVLARVVLVTGTGLLLTVLLAGVGPNASQLGLALFGVLSVLLLMGAISVSRWTPHDRVLAMFAIGLVAISAGLTFAYFRQRNVYLSLVGWSILWALVFRNARDGRWQEGIRFAAAVLFAVTFALDAGTAYLSYPLPRLTPEGFNPSNGLCSSGVPNALALQVALVYGIDQDAVQACRQTNFLGQ